jgi:hypothetical protein
VKLGYREGKGYYVGWYCKESGEVVYTWFPDFDQAIAFMERGGN